MKGAKLDIPPEEMQFRGFGGRGGNRDRNRGGEQPKRVD
jgi:hypothetical protein